MKTGTYSILIFNLKKRENGKINSSTGLHPSVFQDSIVLPTQAFVTGHIAVSRAKRKLTWNAFAEFRCRACWPAVAVQTEPRPQKPSPSLSTFSRFPRGPLTHGPARRRLAVPP